MFVVLKKKHIIIFVLIILLVFCLPILYFNTLLPAIETITKGNTNWGLSFKENGKTPVGNATQEFLKQYDSYYLGNTAEKKVYITFDAGYENGYTSSILDTLKKHNAKATFFVVGSYIKSAPDLIKRMVDEGHIVGNHTMTHPNMSKISTFDSFKQEITPVEDMFLEVTGKQMPKFYRPPQGIYSEQNLKDAQSLGYKTVFWSLAYVDWYKDKQPTHEQAFEKLMPRVHPGAIILLHSTSKTNSEILDEFLTKLENQGYTFGCLDQLN